jgi:hypothetical protein
MANEMFAETLQNLQHSKQLIPVSRSYDTDQLLPEYKFIYYSELHKT